MKRRTIPLLVTSIALVVATMGGASAAEQETGWSDTAELSFVVTDGNSETSTMGFKNTLLRVWNHAEFKLKASGVRAESTKVSREAVGTDPSSFTVIENRTTDATAEAYNLEGQYDRTIHERLFWFAGGGWDRNRPAGIDNRYTAFGGVGNTWVDTETILFKTDYSLSINDQEDVVANPAAEETFIGGRFSWLYSHKFGENTTYGNELVIDENLDDTSDARLDMLNSVSVSINERVALKVGLRWLYDHQPALQEVALLDAPSDSGGTQIGTVLIERDDLDTVFTTSLVINF